MNAILFDRVRTGADVAVGVQAVLGHVVAQQEVVHREFEGHGELEALPVAGIAVVLVLEGDRVNVTLSGKFLPYKTY